MLESDTRVGRYTYGPRISDLYDGAWTAREGETPDFWGIYVDEPVDPVTGIAAVRWLADVATERLARTFALRLDHGDRILTEHGRPLPDRLAEGDAA